MIKFKEEQNIFRPRKSFWGLHNVESKKDDSSGLYSKNKQSQATFRVGKINLPHYMTIGRMYSLSWRLSHGMNHAVHKLFETYRDHFSPKHWNAALNELVIICYYAGLCRDYDSGI